MRRAFSFIARALAFVFLVASVSEAVTEGREKPIQRAHRDWRAPSSGANSAAKDGRTLQTWGACGAFDSSTKVIRTFSRRATFGVSPYMSSGSSNLACGSSAWGYRHIVANHLTQWQFRASEANENWRDTADYGIYWALSDPDRITYRVSNDTYCFSRLINLVNRSNGQVVDHYYPNVVIAHVTRNIITAYPSSTQC
jgi:hypothetical protein